MVYKCICHYFLGLFTLRNRDYYNFSFSNNMQEAIDTRIRDSDFDVLYVDSPPMAYYASRVSLPKVIEVLDSVQIYYDGYLSETNLFKKIKMYLLYLQAKSLTKEYTHFDRCITVTKEDARNLLKYEGDLNIAVIPFGVTVSPLNTSPGEDYPSILFIGNLGSKFNQDSAKYIYNDIFSSIRAKYPDLKYYIVGKDPSDEIKQLAQQDPQVTVTGYVEDIKPHVLRASVIVLPVHGYGIKTRILEVMAWQSQ